MIRKYIYYSHVGLNMAEKPFIDWLAFEKTHMNTKKMVLRVIEQIIREAEEE
ncbi:unnamed protein product [marine sediment metagenome]|uniref:Uncharacterized protein n=1 Tax=marine sediment metagenome TaxID=412755 RepID=X1CMP5_9ZZZZ